MTRRMKESSNKDQMAKELAEAHHEADPSVRLVVRIVSGNEADPAEPVKLLEVNPETFSSGIVPLAFGAYPPRIRYPSVIVEVTDDEYEAIKNNVLPLPKGWKLAEVLFEAS